MEVHEEKWIYQIKKQEEGVIVNYGGVWKNMNPPNKKTRGRCDSWLWGCVKKNGICQTIM